MRKSYLHIISHGSPESLYLGNTPLKLDNLQNYQSLITTWNVESILLHNSNSNLDSRDNKSDRISYVGLIGKLTNTNKINLSDTFLTTPTPEAGSKALPEVNQIDTPRDEKAIFAKFGTTGNAGFGNGQLLMTLSGTSDLIATDVNVNLLGANFLFS
ncbi:MULTISPECIES: DUF4347 domain-containing protein [unclassified Nodularia (in: cyanobacteria)]|uniref:DUF4347 domain-containing protein n=1 Tax=unclassified Nodularia (in: cyanobacteria) TaxID=2656917 RepID=UPI00187DE721|nr:DUF4347 domain-containing protein [Nodularia sp. LEGE 06071]MBE9197700.1 DUF4347 domain-containing protein [Nodularia sp. LEGE 06071]MCC2694006.1 DUF4347 domain-containing protein [Nodularia sp. LEGE 04288]